MRFRDARYVHLLLGGLLLCGGFGPADPAGVPTLDDRLKALPQSLRERAPVLRPKAAAPSDPIEPIADRMGDVTVDLGAMRSGAPVQSNEKQVVSDLDTLIAQLEKQCKSGGGGGNPNPSKPMGSSVLAGGPGGSGPLHDPKAGTRVWGQLPPKLRDQIMQSQTEGFPAGYESILSTYYSKLAQAQTPGGPSAAADNAPAGPATQPAGR